MLIYDGGQPFVQNIVKIRFANNKIKKIVFIWVYSFDGQSRPTRDL